MKTLLMAAFAAAASTFASQQAGAVEIYDMNKFPTSIQIDGKIEYGDEKFLLQVLEERRNEGKTTEFAVLNSHGGNSYSGMEMALLIRGHGIKTVVGEENICASACMLMFAGGIERFAWHGAMLGVHGATYNDPNGYSGESPEGTIRLAKAMRFLGAPAAVVALLVTTSPDDMSWLDNRDVQGWVQILDPRQEQQQEQRQQPQQGPVISMSCQGQKGPYAVNWDRNDPGNVQVNDRWYRVAKSRFHPGTTLSAWVVSGKTKYGHYTAVIGGKNPRMEFSNGKEKVTDKCW